jgi:hypothetical protein
MKEKLFMTGMSGVARAFEIVAIGCDKGGKNGGQKE